MNEGGERQMPDEGQEYIVEPLNWTDEQNRQWILCFARLCVDLYNKQNPPNIT